MLIEGNNLNRVKKYMKNKGWKELPPVYINVNNDVKAFQYFEKDINKNNLPRMVDIICDKSAEIAAESWDNFFEKLSEHENKSISELYIEYSKVH